MLNKFFYANSKDPQKSIKLSRAFGFCTIPGIAALCVATYSAMFADGIKYAFIGNIVLTLINIAIAACGIIYKKRNSFCDTSITKNRAAQYRTKDIIVYFFVGVLFFCILLFFMLGTVGIIDSRQNTTSYRSAISIGSDLITILTEKGYETANIPALYWDIDENKPEHLAVGVKENGRFEFYGYNDNKTVDLIYDKIVNLISAETENIDAENHETSFSDGSKKFTITIDGVYHLVIYRNDTLIYAYSSDSPDEIGEILERIGYSN